MNVDYVTLLPINFLGFYNIPKATLLNNLKIFFQTQTRQGDYTFGLMAEDESIFGYSSKININIGTFLGAVSNEELKAYELTKPLLPGFPSLI